MAVALTSVDVSKGEARVAPVRFNASSWQRAGVCVFVATCGLALVACLSLASVPDSLRDMSAGESSARALKSCTPRPVFLLHGLEGNSGMMSQLAGWIRSAYPGTQTFQIPLFENDASMTSLPKQLPDLAKYIRDTVAQDPDSFESGYDLVGFSQGGLLCRALVQYMDDHNAHTLISLAGPQMGLYGDNVRALANEYLQTSGVGPVIAMITGKPADLNALAYEDMLQESASAANMWNDPTRRAEYLEKNVFLPVYNGLTSDSAGNQRRKTNFLRLTKAVFMVGDFDFGSSAWDGSLEPWQSGIFGFFKDGSVTELVSMEETEEYRTDSFGLKTLHQEGRLTVMAPSQVSHASWTDDFNVVNQYVLPYLGDCALVPNTATVTTTVTTSTTLTTSTTVPTTTMPTSTTTSPMGASVTTSTASTSTTSMTSITGSMTSSTIPPTTSVTTVSGTTSTNPSTTSMVPATTTSQTSGMSTSIMPATTATTTMEATAAPSTSSSSVSATTTGMPTSTTEPGTTTTTTTTTTESTTINFLPMNGSMRASYWPGAWLLMVLIFAALL